MNDYIKIDEILTALLDALNFNFKNAEHRDAYHIAFDSLCNLIDKIDSAERI